MKLVSRDYLFLIYKLFQALYQAPERKKTQNFKKASAKYFHNILLYLCYVCCPKGPFCTPICGLFVCLAERK